MKALFLLPLLRMAECYSTFCQFCWNCCSVDGALFRAAGLWSFGQWAGCLVQQVFIVNRFRGSCACNPAIPEATGCIIPAHPDTHIYIYIYISRGHLHRWCRSLITLEHVGPRVRVGVRFDAMSHELFGRLAIARAGADGGSPMRAAPSMLGPPAPDEKPGLASDASGLVSMDGFPLSALGDDLKTPPLVFLKRSLALEMPRRSRVSTKSPIIIQSRSHPRNRRRRAWPAELAWSPQYGLCK